MFQDMADFQGFISDRITGIMVINALLKSIYDLGLKGLIICLNSTLKYFEYSCKSHLKKDFLAHFILKLHLN